MRAASRGRAREGHGAARPAYGWRERAEVADAAERPRPAYRVRGSTINYTKNARSRMEDRGILEEEVRAVLDGPDASAVSVGDRKVASKRIDGRVLEVVYLRDTANPAIVTAYWLDG